MIVQLSPAPETARDELGVAIESIYRLSVKQYHEMIRAGIFSDDESVELLEGLLVKKKGKHRRHSLLTQRIRIALENLRLGGYYVEAQEPVTTRTSEPEPDVAVIRGNREDYQDRHPGQAETFLAVEVSDTAPRRERGIKKQLYARARIPVYWIVNLGENQIEVHTQPSGPARRPDYTHRQDYGLDTKIPVILEGRKVGQLSVGELMR